MYAEVQSSDPADLINSSFGGRFCGPMIPRRRISLYRAVALSFFTSKNLTTPDIFGGYYRFINECEYINVHLIDHEAVTWFCHYSLQRNSKLAPPSHPIRLASTPLITRRNGPAPLYRPPIRASIPRICPAPISLWARKTNAFV